ncbi:Small RNA 2'-O-methyltransferase-like [Thalictrum thalictroides]|uniref:Small RNA 2'-O-methyltransferase n=1 Tax=Thalictrum thalictroides TaxID=46969 RepID=A0A7J6WA03_THATH|nr:Small RNA 2'-O-methyltransferase-like [Thalictrum thalictroides]
MTQVKAMEVEEIPAVVAKRPPPTPKAIIHLKYGKNACYKTEEVVESVQTGCPGLSFLQKGPCFYRCSLQLPEFSITSEPFKKKKDAEQSAAKLAIEKLGIQTTASDLTMQEAHDELVSRISYLFSDEVKFLSSLHPLTGHFKQTLRKSEGEPHGCVPAPVLAAYDSKLNNLCKYINPKAESNILLTVELIMGAARSCDSVVTSEETFWIWKQTPYIQEAKQELLNKNSGFEEDISVEALYIPCSIEKPIKRVSIDVLSNGYYMDAIAQKLGVMDTSHVLVSRIVGKASSEMRFYFSAPQLPLQVDSTCSPSNAKETMDTDATLNARACYFSGQEIHGDAILAAIGYSWRTTDLFNENVSMDAYYRMLVGRLPDGGYKLSRDAILAAELPLKFTNRSNWRGSFPKDLLSTFCRQNWLSEPEFSSVYIDESGQSSEILETCKKLKLSNSSKEVVENGGTGDANGVESVGQKGTFRCEVKILSRNKDLIIVYSPQEAFRKPNDAIQNASLEVLSWLNRYFKHLNVSTEKYSSGDIHGIHVYPHTIQKEFALCLSVQNAHQDTSVYNARQSNGFQRCTSVGPQCMNMYSKQNELQSFHIEGQDSGVYPSSGYLACISYSISIKQAGEHMKELLEKCDEFEFEIGSGAVSPLLEACVTQMSINQSACFISELPPWHLILAAARNQANSLSLLSMQDCWLEYSINLIRATEPMEDRMEQALFSPPLSKQRVEYALKHINESGAATLVDFGCGSGSLLESLMSYPTSLEKIVGVDISRKGLTRAAKVLHSKLNANSEALTSNTSIKSALLYDGSITVFDQRLYGFDIGTCLEVIEHMEEDQASLFGDVALGFFCPKILIVSTPNYEYNPILQKNSPSSQEEKEEDKTEFLPCKFRNYDHKFEWTRKQFQCWASDLASRHKYNVEFSGVGGSGDLEPGFASQIAVFRNHQVNQEDHFLRTEEMTNHYELIWEWDNNCKSRLSL